MDTEKQKMAAAAASTSLGGQDEVDFTSGYETQYHKEYAPLNPIYVPPTDKRNAWFRSWSTILMIVFLISVFLLGTILLVTLVFTASVFQVLLIVAAYVVIAAFIIWLDVQSIKVR